jgi:lipid II:glycine glycyltransferase (peptidoglycan interpeptide bridge formation enzyme)
MLKPRLITSAAEWNRSILELPAPHILQSWEWGAFKAKYGWTPLRVLFCDGNRTRAAAQVLRRPLPHTPFGVLYVPKGPLLDYADPTLLGETLAALESIAREQRGIFIKIDPDVVKTVGSGQWAVGSEPRPEKSGQWAVDSGRNGAEELLVSRRWRVSHEQIQFRNTMLLDLGRSEEEILAGMKPKTRYNIRLASKRGVRVEVGTVDDLNLFYEMYKETSARDGFLIREFPYYRDAWGAFIKAGLAHMLLARLEDATVAGLILFRFGDRAWYFYGASREAHREAMPNHVLQWQAILWAKAQGCTTYDFWGAPDTLDPNAPMYGVYRFKEGFGGRFTPHIGAYDYVVNPTLYFLYAVVRPRYLDRLRARHPNAMGTGAKIDD